MPPHPLVRHLATAGSVKETFREVVKSCATPAGRPLAFCEFPHCGCEPVGHIHVAHVACWKVARGAHTLRSILAIARRLLPLFPVGIGGLPTAAQTMPADFLGLRPSLDTSLGRLVAQIATRLPLELQTRIVIELGKKDPLASLTRATHVAASWPVVSDSHRGPARELHTSPGPITHIRAPKHSIFGREYLRDVRPCRGVDGAEATQAESIEVRQAGLRGIRFAIDRLGIRGLRVFYDDGSESPLLGSDKDCWLGEARGESLEKLWLTRDVGSENTPRTERKAAVIEEASLTSHRQDFRVIRIDFDENPGEAGPDGVQRALWSCRTPLTDGLTNVIANPSSSLRRSPSSFYPGWRFIQYLPLSQDGAYTSSITAFMGEGLPVGLRVAGVRRQASARDGSGDGAVIIGKPGAPNHLALGVGERITGAWARWTYGRLYDDCLVVALLP